VRATGVVLPTAGFTLAGLDLTSLTVADVDVPAAGVAGATVGLVRELAAQLSDELARLGPLDE
jgi:hypothetical protein